MPFGNVNVDYAPCKSVGALKAAADYMLGRKKEQVKSGVRKTSEGLYTALGCNRENFANGILVTRKLNGKSYSKHKDNTILAHKMSISFHPLDNVDHKTAFEIARDFAEHFIHNKGYEVLFAVHTDTDHVHVHFLISNCKM
ncbi:MAG: relaxase/mobilization nuclease domain-containing protein, partial [Ruminococcus sp.]|nr:relaxase/mobilization nuclease domain-containing protein [Ruminococcus sp.]